MYTTHTHTHVYKSPPPPVTYTHTYTYDHTHTHVHTHTRTHVPPHRHAYTPDNNRKGSEQKDITNVRWHGDTHTRSHSQFLVLHNVNVVLGASIEAFFVECPPEVGPQFVGTGQQRRYDGPAWKQGFRQVCGETSK